jgi:hypothetical protein
LIATMMASMTALKVLAPEPESVRAWAARLDYWLASGSWRSRVLVRLSRRAGLRQRQSGPPRGRRLAALLVL